MSRPARVKLQVSADRAEGIRRVLADLDWLEKHSPEHYEKAMKELTRIAAGPKASAG